MKNYKFSIAEVGQTKEDFDSLKDAVKKDQEAYTSKYKSVEHLFGYTGQSDLGKKKSLVNNLVDAFRSLFLMINYEVKRVYYKNFASKYSLLKLFNTSDCWVIFSFNDFLDLLVANWGADSTAEFVVCYLESNFKSKVFYSLPNLVWTQPRIINNLAQSYYLSNLTSYDGKLRIGVEGNVVSFCFDTRGVRVINA